MCATIKKARKKRSVIWTIDRIDLQKIINECDTYVAVLRSLNYTNRGSAFRILKERIQADEINDEHLQKCNRSKFCGCTKIADADVFVEGSTYLQGQSIKKRLFQQGIENRCSICGLSNEWCGKVLTLQLDHINGVRNDNRLENLRLLCPNCHSPTHTFAGKNNISKEKVLKNEARTIQTQHNGKVVSARQKMYYDNMAGTPRHSARKVDRPAKDVLEHLLWKMPTVKIAIMYGVSDKAVEKWASSYNLTKPPRGYWAKNHN